ncbi:MAG: tetratricopeptide repeat protein [Verrucomicrobia bacterium]|nr:MAG: tetratricopeptide repeat protein [Verrucomicrobiota bacterium]
MLAALLGILTFLLFAPALHHEFLNYDDGLYVYGNDAVRNGLSADGLAYAAQSIRGGSWMPLTWLSHMLDVTLFGLRPTGHHFTSLLLHSLNAGLLMLFLQRATQRLWPGLFVAALFAFHPLRNESVAWIAERKDVLCAFFWLLGLLAYLRFVEKQTARRLAVVALCLALALMSKPMAVTFPFVLLLLDFWPLRRLEVNGNSLKAALPKLVKEKAILFLLVALAATATFLSQREIGAMKHHTAPVAEQLTAVPPNYVFYLQKSFLPTGLTVLYPDRKPEARTVVTCAVALAAVTALLIAGATKFPWATFGWLWFVGTLVPVIGFVRVGHIAVADRYTYLPSIGLTILIVWSVAETARKSALRRRLAATVAFVALAVLTLATRADLSRWRDSLALFEAANRIAPHAIAWNSLAVYHLDRGEYAAAITPASRAIQLNPRYENAFLNRAIAREKTGDLAGAKLDRARVDGSEPRSAEGYLNRAAMFLNEARYDDAIRDFSFALEFDPACAVCYNNRASVHLLKGDPDAALEDCARAIASKPDYGNAYTTRGNVYSAKKNFPAALADYDRAIQFSPGDAIGFNNRAAVHFQLQQYEAAWADIRRCRELGGTPHAGLVEALTQASGVRK